MKLDWLKNLAVNAIDVGKEKLPTILTTLGLGFGVTTVVLVAKESPEAKEKKEAAIKKAEEENLTGVKKTWEIIKAVTPCYGKAIATGIAGAGCIISSDVIVNKRLTNTTKNLAAATAGYFAVKEELNNYKKTAEEVLGEAKKKDLDRKVAEKQMQESDAKEEDAKELKYTNEGDKQLVYDHYVDDYYRSSIPDLLKVVKKLELRAQGSMDGEIPFTDWYDEIGYILTLEKRQIYEGWGFKASIHNSEDVLGFDYTATLSPNDTPCLEIEFNNLVPLWKVKKNRYA